MKFIQGQDRTQTHIFPVSLDATIDTDNEVRLIDLFVDSLRLKDLGFRVDFPENGRLAYHPSDLIKLYLYGYLNKVRSSRDLEKECKRNIEVMWLLHSLHPDHNTISNFRRDNPGAIKKVFRATVQMAKHFKLIGGRLLAGDSTKFRAQNIENNKLRIENNPSAYKKRHAIVEHPYGTIKRQWGFSYISTKKYKVRASADVGLMFVAYNLRRIMSVIGKNELRNYLGQLVSSFLQQKPGIWMKYLRYKTPDFFNHLTGLVFYRISKRLKFDQLLIKI